MSSYLRKKLDDHCMASVSLQYVLLSGVGL